MTSPVWTWLPGSNEPVMAAHIDVEAGAGRFVYEASYPSAPGARPLDPMHLRLGRGAAVIKLLGEHALPGVIQDSMPDGYGRDRLQARHARELGPMELLALGPPDGVGAIEVCSDIEAKLRWRPHTLHELIEQVQLLDENVYLRRLWFKRNDLGKLSLWRAFYFEFTVTGGDRYYGRVIMLGSRITQVELDPHRLH